MNNNELYNRIMEAIAVEVKKHLNELSVETARSASEKAIEDIKSLSELFANSKFQDMNILAKLQRRARQVDVFNNYVDMVNNNTISFFSGAIKRVLNKWKNGKTLSNGAIFKPLFVITSSKVTQWGKSFGYGNIEWRDLQKEALQLKYLTVIGLNSDFENEKKQLTKAGLDTSNIEAIEAEYEAINDELKNDLNSIVGLKYVYKEQQRRNSRNPYNTSLLYFKIDLDIIDIDKAVELLPGYLYTDVSSTKYDRSRGWSDGRSFQTVYRDHNRSQELQ